MRVPGIDFIPETNSLRITGGEGVGYKIEKIVGETWSEIANISTVDNVYDYSMDSQTSGTYRVKTTSDIGLSSPSELFYYVAEESSQNITYTIQVIKKKIKKWFNQWINIGFNDGL